LRLTEAFAQMRYCSFLEGDHRRHRALGYARSS